MVGFFLLLLSVLMGCLPALAMGASKGNKSPQQGLTKGAYGLNAQAWGGFSQGNWAVKKSRNARVVGASAALRGMILGTDIQWALEPVGFGVYFAGNPLSVKQGLSCPRSLEDAVCQQGTITSRTFEAGLRVFLPKPWTWEGGPELFPFVTLLGWNRQVQKKDSFWSAGPLTYSTKYVALGTQAQWVLSPVVSVAAGLQWQPLTWGSMRVETLDPNGIDEPRSQDFLLRFPSGGAAWGGRLSLLLLDAAGTSVGPWPMALWQVRLVLGAAQAASYWVGHAAPQAEIQVSRVGWEGILGVQCQFR